MTGREGNSYNNFVFQESRETVWLIDVMWPWGYQWELTLMAKIEDLKIQRRDGNENGDYNFASQNVEILVKQN